MQEEPKTEEQLKAERFKEQNRIRAARRYEKKKMEINEARRLQYQEKEKPPKPEKSPKPEKLPKEPKPPKGKVITTPTMINGFDQSRNELFLKKLSELEINQYTKAKYIGDFKRLLTVISHTDI